VGKAARSIRLGDPKSIKNIFKIIKNKQNQLFIVKKDKEKVLFSRTKIKNQISHGSIFDYYLQYAQETVHEIL